MHTVSVFFADTVMAKARQTSTMTSIILTGPRGDRETMQASSAYSIYPTPHNIVHINSRLQSHRCRRFLQARQLCVDDRILAESFFFFYITYSRWTSSLPSCLWSLRIFPSLPGSRLTIFYRDASSALLQLVNQWLNFTYSRSHAFRYERTQILLW